MVFLHVKPAPECENYYINHKAAYAGDSGIDLFFPEDVVCNPGITTLVDLKITCMMKDVNGNKISYYLFPRSSISKTPLIMHNSVGIIDSGYRSTIKVAVRNISNTAYFIRAGDRLFQICSPNLDEVKMIVTQDIQDEGRGSGFGSSGVSGKIM